MAIINLDEFERALKSAANAKEQDFQTAALEAMQDLHFKVVGDTPIDTGEAASNWNLGINVKDDSVTTDTSYSNLNKVSSEVKAAIASKTKIDYIYLSNGTIQARMLEYGLYKQRGDSLKKGSNVTKGGYRTINGYSTQAPSGMLRKNITLFVKMFENRVKRLGK